jgi:hypothetical protein
VAKVRLSFFGLCNVMRLFLWGGSNYLSTSWASACGDGGSRGVKVTYLPRQSVPWVSRLLQSLWLGALAGCWGYDEVLLGYRILCVF